MGRKKVGKSENTSCIQYFNDNKTEQEKERTTNDFSFVMDSVAKDPKNMEKEGYMEVKRSQL